MRVQLADAGGVGVTYARRKDTKHNDIAQWFRDVGWAWADTHTVGDGFPDAVAAWRDWTVAIECKTGSERPNGDQLLWLSEWPGHKAIVYPAATEATRKRVIEELLNYGARRFVVLIGHQEVWDYCGDMMRREPQGPVLANSLDMRAVGSGRGAGSVVDK